MLRVDEVWCSLTYDPRLLNRRHQRSRKIARRNCQVACIKRLRLSGPDQFLARKVENVAAYEVYLVCYIVSRGVVCSAAIHVVHSESAVTARCLIGAGGRI